MSLKNECSIKDCTELRNLIIKNPELPLILFVGEEAWNGEYDYSQAECSKAKIKELTLYNDMWMDRDEYEDTLSDNLAFEEEYAKLTDKEYDEMIKGKIANTEFIKAIVLYAG